MFLLRAASTRTLAQRPPHLRCLLQPRDAPRCATMSSAGSADATAHPASTAPDTPGSAAPAPAAASVEACMSDAAEYATSDGEGAEIDIAAAMGFGSFGGAPKPKSHFRGVASEAAVAKPAPLSGANSAVLPSRPPTGAGPEQSRGVKRGHASPQQEREGEGSYTGKKARDYPWYKITYVLNPWERLEENMALPAAGEWPINPRTQQEGQAEVPAGSRDAKKVLLA